MKAIPLLIGAAVLIIGVGIVGQVTGTWSQFFKHGVSCANQSTFPRGGGSIIDATVHNDNDTATYTLCAIQSRTERVETRITLAPGEVRTVRFEVPDSDDYFVLLDGEAVETGYGFIDPVNCPGHIAHISFWIKAVRLGEEFGPSHVEPPQCGAGETQADTAASPGFWSPGSGAGGLVLGLLCIATLPLLVPSPLRRQAQWFFVGLFTRLQRHRVLDQGVRAQIYEAVRIDPGVHYSELVDRLEIAQGQAMHHLRVLRREGFLTCVGLQGGRHFFLTGRMSSEEMRRLAVLRRPLARELYELVRREPGITITQAALRLGISLVHGSRLAKLLHRSGLLRRTQEGRHTRLEALAFPVAGALNARPRAPTAA